MITALVEPGALVAGLTLELYEEETHHLRVRRAEDGSTLRLAEGVGGIGQAVLRWAGKRAMAVVTEVVQHQPPVGLMLAVAAGDRDRFHWIAEKASELDVTEIVPVETARSANVSGRLLPAHVDKLARRAREAIKQSGAAWAPVVWPIQPLAVLLDGARVGERWLADQVGATLPGRVTGPVTILVGPEGGFTGEESAAILAAGWTPVRFGTHILRFETAAIAAAVAVGLTRGEGRG